MRIQSGQMRVDTLLAVQCQLGAMLGLHTWLLTVSVAFSKLI